MQLLKRPGRVLRLRVRTVLILVALVGLGAGIWANPVGRAWIHRLLGRHQDAWAAAIQAPRGPMRDRVLVAALAAIADDGAAGSKARQAALVTLSCLVPESGRALPTIERALTDPQLAKHALQALGELSRVDPAAARAMLGLRDSPLVVAEGRYEFSKIGDNALLEAAFLQAIKDPDISEDALRMLIESLAWGRDNPAHLTIPLVAIVRDPARPERVRDAALLVLAHMRDLGDPVSEPLLAILADAESSTDLKRRIARILSWMDPSVRDAARAHASALLDHLERESSGWDELDVGCYAAYASPPERVRERLLEVVEGAGAWAARQAALRALLEIDHKGEYLDFMVDSLLPDPKFMRLLLATVDKQRLLPRRPVLMEALPPEGSPLRAWLLFQIATLAPPDAELTQLFHRELQAGDSQELAQAALWWIQEIGPDEVALGSIRRLGPWTAGFSLGLEPLFRREICPQSHDALRTFAFECMRSPHVGVGMRGAILLANIDPADPAICTWLAPQLTPETIKVFPGGFDRSPTLGLAAWLGPHARALSPQLFRNLMDGDEWSCEALRSVEARPGWERPPEAPQ